MTLLSSLARTLYLTCTPAIARARVVLRAIDADDAKAMERHDLTRRELGCALNALDAADAALVAFVAALAPGSPSGSPGEDAEPRKRLGAFQEAPASAASREAL